MSIFKTETFACPKCGTSITYDIVASVNADRRPDLRAKIVDNSFQRSACEKCGHPFRLEPEMTYFDAGRKQWILVLPANQVTDWPYLEQNARSAFDRTYGEDAPEEAQAIGENLSVRVAFGWPALREKLLAVDLGLDDVTLELMKMAIFGGTEQTPLSDEIELRLTGAEGNELILEWLDGAVEFALEELRVPRALYQQVAEDPKSWESLRQELTAGPFVDFARLLVPSGREQEAEEETVPA